MANRMTGTCSVAGCSNTISSANKTGVCTPCQQGRKSNRATAGSAPARRRAAAPPPEPFTAEEVAEASPPAEEAPSHMKQFYTLAEALGLDPEAMLDEHCRAWVETTRTRALGESPVQLAPAPAPEASVG